jgi:hypothetical protein
MSERDQELAAVSGSARQGRMSERDRETRPRSLRRVTRSCRHICMTWRTEVSRRVSRWAGDDDPDEPGPGPGTFGQHLTEEEGETPEAFAARRLRSVIEELYPTVAPRVLALAEHGPAVDVDEWVAVARLLYDAHMHRVGGPSIEARQRALLATLGQALEAQAKSSARLAGYTDDELAKPSTFDGDEPGTLIWEHYLCPPARLARSALHGEAVADWLGALGELWTAPDALYQLAERDDPDEELTVALDRAKVALVRVQELSLW